VEKEKKTSVNVIVLTIFGQVKGYYKSSRSTPNWLQRSILVFLYLEKETTVTN
jgi:hypothetical protein